MARVRLVLTHSNNSPWIDMSHHSETLSWFWANTICTYSLMLQQRSSKYQFYSLWFSVINICLLYHHLDWSRFSTKYVLPLTDYSEQSQHENESPSIKQRPILVLYVSTLTYYSWERNYGHEPTVKVNYVLRTKSYILTYTQTNYVLKTHGALYKYIQTCCWSGSTFSALKYDWVVKFPLHDISVGIVSYFKQPQLLYWYDIFCNHYNVMGTWSYYNITLKFITSFVLVFEKIQSERHIQ